jgi:hypothetical protein
MVHIFRCFPLTLTHAPEPRAETRVPAPTLLGLSSRRVSPAQVSIVGARTRSCSRRLPERAGYGSGSSAPVQSGFSLIVDAHRRTSFWVWGAVIGRALPLGRCAWLPATETAFANERPATTPWLSCRPAPRPFDRHPPSQVTGAPTRTEGTHSRSSARAPP